MTVGFVDAVEVGRLFAARQYVSLILPATRYPLVFLLGPFRMYGSVVGLTRWKPGGVTDVGSIGVKKEDNVQERVVSSCKIRPACKILKYDGEGG